MHPNKTIALTLNLYHHYVLGQTEIICHPRGYPGEAIAGFNPGLIGVTTLVFGVVLGLTNRGAALWLLVELGLLWGIGKFFAVYLQQQKVSD
ncbi:MAG: hypothetical protein AAGG51_09495 [Cyanobacteria bacterium P01_G01_bin.54]